MERLTPRESARWRELLPQVVDNERRAEAFEEVVCLRIGSFSPEPGSGPDGRSLWLSPRDTVQLVIRALGAEAIDFVIVYGVSANRHPFYATSAQPVSATSRKTLRRMRRASRPADPSSTRWAAAQTRSREGRTRSRFHSGRFAR